MQTGTSPGDSVQNDRDRLMVFLNYGLFLIAPMGGLTALLAAVIAHLRLPYAAGTWMESHYRNQIRVFWTVLIYLLVMMGLVIFGAGYSFAALWWPPAWPFWQGAMLGLGWALLLPLVGLFSVIMLVWYYWRLVGGLIRALDDKPW